MTIQKLSPSQHREGRWLVWLSDGTLLRVGEGDVVSLALYAGKELNPGEEDALREAGRRSALWEKALSLLAARPMSRKELLDKLTASPRTQRDTPSEPLDREALSARAEAVAGRLCELGLLDDGAYAHTVVQHYAAKGYGVRKLRDELYRRGVPREYWEDALAEAETDEDQIDRLARQKLRGQEPTRENLKRVSDYLARRGFRWDDISAALARLREEDENL